MMQENWWLQQQAVAGAGAPHPHPVQPPQQTCAMLAAAVLEKLEGAHTVLDAMMADRSPAVAANPQDVPGLVDLLQRGNDNVAYLIERLERLVNTVGRL